MESIPTELNANMLIAAGLLVISYAFIFSEVIHRTSAAIIGAVIMIIVGMLCGFYSQEAAIRAIDANTIFLLTGMMMVVAMLRPTGIFEYLAIRITKFARGDSRLLLVYLSFSVSIISMVLDNVTTVIIFAPLTILITRILNLSPIPFLMAEAMLSNIGGAATLVGDPPNIMIGSAGGIDFSSFLLHMAPPVMAAWVCTTGLMLFMFRDQLVSSGIPSIDLDERHAIKDPSALKRILAALGLIVGLFFVHHRLHISPAFASFIGLALALVLLRPRPEDLFGEVNWSVLFFFAGLFVIVGGVEGSGLLNLAGHKLSLLSREPGMMLISALLLMWVAAILSAIIDNIPFTVAMIPIIVGLEGQGVNITPLWWALAIGVGLGGNGTHIGATANLIVVAELEECDIPGSRITPALWLQKGLPTMLVSLLVASMVYAGFFEFFL